VYYFYAIDVNTLEDKEGFPILLDGTHAGNDPRRYFIGGTVLQRPPVLQLGDVVYAAFGGMCDGFNYSKSNVGCWSYMYQFLLAGTLLGVDVKQKKVSTISCPNDLLTLEVGSHKLGNPSRPRFQVL